MRARQKVKVDSKVAELKKKVEELNNVIESYKQTDLVSDSRKKEVNEKHSRMTKSLLKSIDQLKKENAFLKEGTKGNLLEQYKQELAKKDFTIDVLRRLIADNERCDAELAKAFNKKSQQSKTSSYYKISIENHKATKGKKIDTQTCVPENTESFGNKVIALEAELDGLKIKSRTEVSAKNNEILELKNELRDVKIELKGKEEKLKRIEELIEQMREEMKEKSKIKTDLDLMNVKCKEYKEEIVRLMKESLAQPVIKSASDIEHQEMLIRTVGLEEEFKNKERELKAERKKYNEEIKAREKEIIKLESENRKLGSQIKQLIEENREQLIINDRLKDKLANHEVSYKERSKAFEGDYKQLEHQANLFKSDKSDLNTKYIRALVHIEELETLVQGKNIELDIYQAKLEDYQNNSNMKENEVDIETLKKKIKELTRREVELLEELEKERVKNKLESDKLKILSLLNSQKKNTNINRLEGELGKYKTIYETTYIPSN